VKLPRRSDACAVQPEALKDADVKDWIALRSQDLLSSRGSEDLAAALASIFHAGAEPLGAEEQGAFLTRQDAAV
jgi:hypothetical protein